MIKDINPQEKVQFSMDREDLLTAEQIQFLIETITHFTDSELVGKTRERVREHISKEPLVRIAIYMVEQAQERRRPEARQMKEDLEARINDRIDEVVRESGVPDPRVAADIISKLHVLKLYAHG